MVDRRRCDTSVINRGGHDRGRIRGVQEVELGVVDHREIGECDLGVHGCHVPDDGDLEPVSDVGDRALGLTEHHTRPSREGRVVGVARRLGGDRGTCDGADVGALEGDAQGLTCGNGIGGDGC